MMIIIMVALKFDFGPMKKKASLGATAQTPTPQSSTTPINGKVIDLVLPILVLIASCVFFMVYTGGIFDGANIVDSFANCNAAVSLTYGAIFTLLFVFLLYIPRKVATIKDFSDSFVEGFSQCYCNTHLMCLDALNQPAQNSNRQIRVPASVSEDTLPLYSCLAVFLVALGIAFATRTSWGTSDTRSIVCAIADYVMTDTLVLTTAAATGRSVWETTFLPFPTLRYWLPPSAMRPLEHVSRRCLCSDVAACSLVRYLVQTDKQSVAVLP